MIHFLVSIYGSCLNLLWVAYAFVSISSVLGGSCLCLNLFCSWWPCLCLGVHDVEIAFCTLTSWAPISQWCWKSKAQGCFKAQSSWNWLEESIFEKYNYFYELNKLFLENKDYRNPRSCYAYTHLRMHAQAPCMYASCMCTHTRANVHMLGFQKLWKTSFFALKFGFSNEKSHIV